MSNQDQERAGYEQSSPKMVSLVDPYVYQAFQSFLGKHVVVQTTKESLRGVVCDVKPDHVVIDVSGAQFFVRTQTIIWVMPY
ncbi:YuzF family protein [Alkalihalobacterium bogoriense]|uniref:YuzF family protein n=1 Tax=Alkalihalobacterium bogoriense TaxID=246272 RepID=UPI00047DC067|nr:YuzF family protein [Alkalihalobacterium bogoriense]